MITIVLADDHNLVRAGVRALLEDLPDVRVVAECADGRAAVAAVAEHDPDMALLDIAMPLLSGLDAAAQIVREHPRTRVVVVSMHSTERYVSQALAAGVAGYMLKDACADELPLLVRAVMAGETYLSPAISKQLVDSVRHKEPEGPLTARQREILALLAAGKNTKEVGHLLGLSPKTVETHRAQIMARLDIRDLAGLVRYAIRTGLVTPED
jgi:DNA-binding NarL/FixJ family response regulator